MLCYITRVMLCYSGAPRAREARVDGAPWLSKSTHPRKFGNHVTVHRPPTADRPFVRTTGKPMFTLTHLLSLGAQEKTNCTSMLWSIDSYQNRASANQYHLTVPRAQVTTRPGRVFFEVIRWQITSFKWSQAQVYFFQGFISNMLCYVTIAPHYYDFDFKLT